MRALSLAWAYRHGKPREMTDPDSSDASQFHPIGPNGHHTVGVAVIKVGGNKDDYLQSLRTLNAAMASDDDDAARRLPDTDDAE
jgi:hypothetical protein